MITGSLAISAETPEEVATTVLMILSGGANWQAQFDLLNSQLAEILAAVKAGGQGLAQAQIDELFRHITDQKQKLDSALTDNA